MSTVPVFVGLDYHSHAIQVCILAADGRLLANRNLRNDATEVDEFVRRHGPVGRAAIEACPGAAHLADELATQTGWDIRLAHPGFVSRMRQTPDKTDWADARVLADLVRVGYLPTVWLAPEAVRALRRVTRLRQQLVDTRRSIKLRVRAVLRECRVKLPARGGTKAWRAELAETPLPDQARWVIDRHLRHVQFYDGEIAAVEQRIAKLVAPDAVVAKLMRQVGVGLVTAAVMRAEIGRFDRFRNGKQLARYCGLTPHNASSGQRPADAGLVKAGNTYLRAVLIEAAHRRGRLDPRWKQLRDAMRGRGKSGSVVAAAVANRWVRGLVHEMTVAACVQGSEEPRGGQTGTRQRLAVRPDPSEGELEPTLGRGPTRSESRWGSLRWLVSRTPIGATAKRLDARIEGGDLPTDLLQKRAEALDAPVALIEGWVKPGFAGADPPQRSPVGRRSKTRLTHPTKQLQLSPPAVTGRPDPATWEDCPDRSGRANPRRRDPAASALSRRRAAIRCNHMGPRVADGGRAMRRGWIGIGLVIVVLLAPDLRGQQPAPAPPAEPLPMAPPPRVVLPPAEVAPAPAPQAVPTPPPRRRYSTLDSSVGYIDNPIPTDQFFLRYDAGYDFGTPNRAEFFYAKPRPAGGPGLPLAERSVDFQDVVAYLEAACDRRWSVFAEVPVRFLNPRVNANTAGLGDVSAGFKYAFWEGEAGVATFQLRAYAPSGDAGRGLGTRHTTLEPALLGFRPLGERLSLLGEFRVWVPVGGTDFAGPVLRYGAGMRYDLVWTDSLRLAPIVEFVGWTVLDGKESRLTPGGVPVILDASGVSIVNVKAGYRLDVGERFGLYAGYGRSITGDRWYADTFRLEGRWLY